MDGQVNLRDANERTISYVNPGPGGKHYYLKKDGKLATLMVRWVSFVVDISFSSVALTCLI